MTSRKDPTATHPELPFKPARVDPRPLVAQLAEALVVARLGEDLEGVHTMRTSSRRLVTWIDLQPKDQRKELKPLRDELKWLRNAAGEVRDLDVQLLRPHPPDMLRWLSDCWNEARPRLIAVIDDPRTAELMDRLHHLEPLDHDLAVQGLSGLAKRALKRGARIGEDVDDEVFHDLRRAVRPVRYGLEWLGLAPGPVKKLQDALGELNDSAVGFALLEAWGGVPDPAELEELTQLRVHGRETSMERWPEGREALRSLRS